MISIEYNRKLPVKFSERKRFEEFIRQVIITSLKRLLTERKIYLNNLLKPFKISSDDIYKELDNLVKIGSYVKGFRIYISPEVKIEEKRLLSVIKAIDFGSTITGLPKLIFFPIISQIKNKILIYYITFLGFR